MEICRDKKTGQSFIYLDEKHNGCSLMITPQGLIKELDSDLFTNPVEVDDPERLWRQGHINQKQYEVYGQYTRR
jgi:hypothetical protein